MKIALPRTRFGKIKESLRKGTLREKLKPPITSRRNLAAKLRWHNKLRGTLVDIKHEIILRRAWLERGQKIHPLIFALKYFPQIGVRSSIKFARRLSRVKRLLRLKKFRFKKGNNELLQYEINNNRHAIDELLKTINALSIENENEIRILENVIIGNALKPIDHK